MPKIIRNLSTPEGRAFWAGCEKAAAQVATWPAAKRAGINVYSTRQVSAPEPPPDDKPQRDFWEGARESAKAVQAGPEWMQAGIVINDECFVTHPPEPKKGKSFEEMAAKVDTANLPSLLAVGSPTKLYLSDFITGILAALALDGVKVLVSSPTFHLTMVNVMAELEKDPTVKPMFRVKPSGLHGKSQTITRGLLDACVRGLLQDHSGHYEITVPNPSKLVEDPPLNPACFKRWAKMLMDVGA